MKQDKLQCPKCKRFVRVTKSGRLIKHYIPKFFRYQLTPSNICPASNTKPNEWMVKEVTRE